MSQTPRLCTKPSPTKSGGDEYVYDVGTDPGNCLLLRKRKGIQFHLKCYEKLIPSSEVFRKWTLVNVHWYTVPGNNLFVIVSSILMTVF